MRNPIPLLWISSTIILTSCQKEKVWVHYTETQCADPWGGYTAPDEEKVIAIREYFATEGVQVYHVTIEAMHQPAVCMACSCTSGNVINCRVREKDLPVMLSHGFSND